LKRVFILKASTARTDNKFTIKDLPGSSGRIDLACRCILAALLTSRSHRTDTIFYAVLDGPPKPPLTIEIDGEKIEQLPRNELQLGLLLRQILNPSASSPIPPGFRMVEKGFRDIVEEQADSSEIYFLHRSGRHIDDTLRSFEKLEKLRLAFILGDHIGLSQGDIEYLTSRGIKPLSLGPKEYLGSHCIFLVHERLDRVLGYRIAQRKGPKNAH